MLDNELITWLAITSGKGQLISKAIYGLLTSPKKRTDEFVLFAFLLFMANKSNSSVGFLGESMARQSAFRFYLTFSGRSFVEFFRIPIGKLDDCAY